METVIFAVLAFVAGIILEKKFESRFCLVPYVIGLALFIYGLSSSLHEALTITIVSIGVIVGLLVSIFVRLIRR